MPKIAPKLASKPSMTATAVTTTPSSPPLLPPPATTTSEPSWLTGSAFKAANEHTYATQRAKKAADRAKGKVPPRKVPSSGGRSAFSAYVGSAPPLSSSSPTRSTATMTAIWAEIWDARKMTTEDLDWPELPTPLSIECAALRPTQDREVLLSALVRPVKPRGAKAKAKGAFHFFLTEMILRLTTGGKTRGRI